MERAVVAVVMATSFRGRSQSEPPLVAHCREGSGTASSAQTPNPLAISAIEWSPCAYMTRATAAFPGSGGGVGHQRPRVRRAPEQLELKCALRCRGDGGLGDRQEADLARFEVVDELDQMLEASAEAIEAPDDEHVAGAHVVKRASELGSMPERSRGDIPKDPLAASLMKRIELEGNALVARGDARVADVLRHPSAIPPCRSPTPGVPPGARVRRRSRSRCARRRTRNSTATHTQLRAARRSGVG